MEDNIITSLGFRSMIDAKYASWSNFTYQLFGDKNDRKDFDVIEFHFNNENLPNNEFLLKQYTENKSFISMGFGRPIEHTTVYFSVIFGSTNQLIHIKNLSQAIFTKIEKNKLSEPIIVIIKLEEFKILAYYLWQ